ncbi:MAG: metallophosphoesterase [Acidobacteriota bacterium]|jgi:hypothetical protein|nr:metallophosphoesterase [Acidobacteriota bacterium]
MKKWYIVNILIILLAAGAWSAANDSVVKAYAGFIGLDRDNRVVTLIGDTQVTREWEFWGEHNRDETGRLLDEIVRRLPAAVLNLGDLVSFGASNRDRRLFDRLHQPLLEAGIPFFPVLGNHDYYGDDEQALNHYFSRVPHLAGRRWYSFVFRNVGFIMLDSNFKRMGEIRLRHQQAWYEAELARMQSDTGIRFIVACCHHPPFTNNQGKRPDPELRTRLAEPFLATGKAALFFSGHIHTYERFRFGDKYFVVSGGGGGTRSLVETNPVFQFHHDEFNGEELRFFHFCELEIADRALYTQVIRLNENGVFSVADSFVVEDSFQRERLLGP